MTTISISISENNISISASENNSINIFLTTHAVNEKEIISNSNKLQDIISLTNDLSKECGERIYSSYEMKMLTLLNLWNSRFKIENGKDDQKPVEKTKKHEKTKKQQNKKDNKKAYQKANNQKKQKKGKKEKETKQNASPINSLMSRSFRKKMNKLIQNRYEIYKRQRIVDPVLSRHHVPSSDWISLEDHVIVMPMCN